MYSKGRIGLSASLFLEFISPPYGIAKKNVRKILFDFLKNRKYNYTKRVASKRKSSLLAARFLLKYNICHEKVCSLSA